MDNNILQLVLASTSRYRQKSLALLSIPFTVEAPNIDENARDRESPANTAQRLSFEKASAVQELHPNALIIGSDQVASTSQRIYGKPHSWENAVEQLRSLSGKTVQFHSGLCLLNTANGTTQIQNVMTEVRFRTLQDSEILCYLDQEHALDCAGSARIEGLGISLVEWVRSDDPSALLGLPLIALCKMLRAEGLTIP